MKTSSKLTYFLYFLKNSPSAIKMRLFHKGKRKDKFLGNKLSYEQSDKLLIDLINGERPGCATRIGFVELSCINNYHKMELGLKKKYKDSVIYSIKNNAGVFPNTPSNLDKYCGSAINALKNTDVLGYMGIHMEDYYVKGYGSKASIAMYEDFEPLKGSYIHALEGKKVLVISSFASDIKKQYQQIDKIFPPSFNYPKYKELSTITMPMTFGSSKPKEKDFFEVLDNIYRQIDKIDFDVALVGAGAYGAIICSYIKNRSKKAIQTGGATPILFGIYSKRWENRKHVSKYINPYWIKPSIKPEGYEKIENGCYW